MKKVFISQPMTDKYTPDIHTDPKFKIDREAAISKAKKILGEDVYTINNVIDYAPDGANSLWYMGECIKLMSEADVIYFCNGWMLSRGCTIEHDCALEYDIPTIYEGDADED